MLTNSDKKNKERTYAQALTKLMMLCSKAERSSGYVIDMLIKWGIDKSVHQQILDALTKEKYIDNKRYALAFTRDKVRFSGWGRRKIYSGLKRRGVSSLDIDEAFRECSPDIIKENLIRVLERKNSTLKEEDDYKRKDKLVRFAISRGFDLDDILSVTDGILSENE